uniref:Uncharacterized protein n=1 Tax=Panagrolaimus sp. PS1159 TaxID=55785 RepID=A0AC35FYN6_9BILA
MGNNCSRGPTPPPSPASHNVFYKENDYNNLVEHLARKEAELEEMKLQNARQQESINRYTQRQTQLRVQMEAEKTKYESAITEMKRAQKSEKDELQQELSRLNRVINDSKADFENKLAAAIQQMRLQMQDRVAKISKENDKLSDPNRICILKDVVAYGKVDYIHLNGKILMVNKLKNDNGKWIADGTEISFKNSKYQICVHTELAIKNIKLSDIYDRIFYSNITKLCITDMKITFDEYQEMVASCNIQYLILRCITVKEKHGIVVDICGLLKEIPNIEKFTYIFKEGESLPIQKLIHLPSLSKLQQFTLSEIQEDFDLKIFIEFIKNNPSAFYELHLRCSANFYDKIKAAEKNIVPTTFKLKIMKLKD